MTERKKRVLLTVLAVAVSVLIIGGLIVVSVLFTKVPAKELYFEKEAISIAVGDSVEIPIYYAPKIASVNYFSYNEDFVKIENGRLIGVGTGGHPYATTVVEARSGDKIARLNVTVYNSTEAGSDTDYVITFLEANEDFGGYQKVLKVLGKNHGSRLTESEASVESDVEGYVFSGEWFFDEACTRQVDFSELAPISSSFALYTEPRILRDGTTRRTRGGKWIDLGIDLIVRMSGDSVPMLTIVGLKYPELPYESIQIPKQYYFNGSTHTVEAIDGNAFDATKKNYSTSDMGDYGGLAESLKTLIMPSTIKIIGHHAFNGLSSLDRIDVRLPARALYLNNPNDPRAGEAAAETENARFDGIGENAFAQTKWLSIQVRKEGNRVVGDQTTAYYAGAILSNCLVAVADDLLAKHGNKMYFFPTVPNTGLAIDAIAQGLALDVNAVFMVDASEVDAYREVVSKSGLSGRISVEAY